MGARGILQYGRLRVVRDLSQIREDNMFDQDMYNRPQNMPQQPYGANMNNTLPQPMNGMNNNRIPSLQSSMMTPNISASSFMPGTGDNGGTPSYRRGGGIRGYMHGGSPMQNQRNMRPSNMPQGGEGFIRGSQAIGNMKGMGGEAGSNYLRQYATDRRGFNNLNQFNDAHGASVRQSDFLRDRVNREVMAPQQQPAQQPNPMDVAGPATYNQMYPERCPMHGHNDACMGGVGGQAQRQFERNYANAREYPNRGQRPTDAPSQYQTTQAALNRNLPQGVGRNVMDYLYSQPEQQLNRRLLNTNPRPLNPGSGMASGGSVGGLSDLMEILKAAQEGEQVHNQIPQYAHGGHVPGYKFGGKIGKALGKVVGVAAPFIGAAVGGPGGAAIGGALGGAMQGGNRKKILKNAAIGAGLGYAGSGGFGELGGIGKIIPSVNAGVGGMMNGQGFSAFSNPFAGGVGAGGVAGANVAGQVAGQNKETPAPGGIGGMLAKAAPWLLGGAVLGTAFGKNKVPYEEPLGVRVAESGMHHKHEPFREARPTDRIARILADDELGVGRAPQFFEDVNPETQYYAAKGGLMRHMANGGYLDGHTGGQDDDIDAKLSDGEYVLSADVVSGLGDGNNRHGAKKLDKFMSNVRSHKYAKGGKGLPPKAKSLESYMKSRRA